MDAEEQDDLEPKNAEVSKGDEHLLRLLGRKAPRMPVVPEPEPLPVEPEPECQASRAIAVAMARVKAESLSLDDVVELLVSEPGAVHAVDERPAAVIVKFEDGSGVGVHSRGLDLLAPS